jgi:hypothetical protein
MLYTAKCYWPGISAREFDRGAATDVAAATAAGSGGAEYLGSILFPRDELVLCLFESSSRSAVQGVTDRAAIPCERILDAVWLAPPVTHATGRDRLRRLACGGSSTSQPGSALKANTPNRRRRTR